ncbi:2,4-dienoyl-CoA reductase, mitochondrial [Strongyloides ratti]|uniref:2,4-dienoyl-CoA reductase, mitochondrial n=1 Tax=Strongyloides ratti TaxID=34506 RepID=A0A090LK79_STRRB|nr:2,4-dienoyl-CoA reductase, mitochondrial [Strongyloides ratti]CEF67955.1 2,4-dienoyl-CoA reductase, mitochondrial [Strongyloides ratti]
MSCKQAAKYFPIIKNIALQPSSYNGKIVLVTGGGTGMGKAMAKTYSYLGGDVAIASRKLDVLEDVAKEIENETGKKVLPIKMDVRNSKEIKNAIDEIESNFGNTPNVVVNNAAGNFISPTERLSENAFKTVMEIVLQGSFNVTNEVGKRIIKKEDRTCSFLYISTPYCRNSAEFVVPSGCSKSGVETLARSLSSEWAKYGMRFNVIAPGPIPTKGAFGNLSNLSMEETIELLSKAIPVGRCGDVQEIANLASFITSDFASWLNGAIIDFDGGQRFFHHPSALGKQLHKISDNEWDKITEAIKKRK